MSLQSPTPSLRSPRQADAFPSPSAVAVGGSLSGAAWVPSTGDRPGVAGPSPLLSLFHLPPPYAQRTPLRFPAGPSRDPLPFGTVVGIEVGGTIHDWAAFEQAILAVRRQAVTAPLVLMIDPRAEDLIFFATRVARLPVRAVLFRGESFDRTLRRQLTHPSNLAEDVVEWLALRGTRLTPVTAHLIRQIFARAPDYHEVVPLLREMGNPESSARFRCRKKRLPSPGRWLHAARALRTAFRMQAEPDRPLLALAHELGYADHSALSNQMLRVFRLRPGAVRRILGWEWLLDRWLAEEAGKARRPPARRDRADEN